MASDHAGLDIFVVQSDGIHILDDLVLVAAIGIDGDGVKNPLRLVDRATENTAVVQRQNSSRSSL
jgi:putative transposase